MCAQKINGINQPYQKCTNEIKCFIFVPRNCVLRNSQQNKENTFPAAFIQSERWNCTVVAHLYIKINLKFGFHPNLIGFKILSIGAEQNVCTSLDKNIVGHSVLLRSKIVRVGGGLY